MDAFVVDAVRTPFAKRNGELRGYHAVDLAAEALRALLQRTGVDPSHIPFVFGGCASPIGEQSSNIARSAAIVAGWSDAIAASTVDGSASSGQLALHAAVAAVAGRVVDAAVVLGVESTSRVPLGATTGTGIGKPFGPSIDNIYQPSGGLMPPGIVAERMSEGHDLDRDLLDEWAHSSRERARASAVSGDRKSEICAVGVRNARGDETVSSIESDSIDDIDSSSEYPATFVRGGSITAANFALPADGAASVLIANENWCRSQGVRPCARVLGVTSAGVDPLIGDTGLAVGSQVTKRVATELTDIERVEIHEDSAATPLAFARVARFEQARINPLGGALAFGEPSGASGVQLITSLVHGMSAAGERRGLAIVAGTAGVATATLLEMVK